MSPQVVDRIELYRSDPVRLMLDSGFTPDPWQQQFLLNTDLMNLVLCARQVGKSLAVAMLVLHTLLTRPGCTIIIVAQRQDTAAEMLRKVVTAFYRLQLPARIIGVGKTHFELHTGARILALPGDERAMHGPTADLLVIDEAARVPDAVFNAASPQLSASKGKLIALSTAFSKSGWFYREWEEGGAGYRRWSITARECPRHTPEFLANERRKMGDRWFDMSYFNVFGDDLAAVFSLDDIRAARADDIQPLFDRSGGSESDPGDDSPQPLFLR